MMIGDGGSLKNSPFNLINCQINCFICSPPYVVPTNNFALPQPAMPALSCIVITPPCAPTATVVPPFDLCIDSPPLSLDPALAARAPALADLPDSAAVAVRPLIIPASEAAAVLFPDSPCAESKSASLCPSSALTAPVLSPSHLESDLLLAVARATYSTIQRAPSLNSFFAGKQCTTLSPPPSTANHPASPLLKEHAELGCPAAVGPAYPLNTILAVIATGPHASTLTPEATAFF